MSRFVTVDGATFFSTDNVDIVGDLDLRAQVKATVGAPTSRRIMLGTQTGSSGYYLSLETLGRIRIAYGNGTTIDVKTSAVPPIVTDSALIDWRVTYELGGTIRYYQNDSEFATQTPTLANGAAGIGLAACAVNANGGVNWDGDMYWAEVRDGIDGPVAARFDADDIYEQVAV